MADAGATPRDVIERTIRLIYAHRDDPRTTVDLAASADAAGLDSLDLAEILLELELAFSVTIERADLYRAGTLLNLAELVARRGGAAVD